MIRLFLTKIFIIFSISQPIASDDNENAFNFINENAVYFLTIIKTEGSKYDEKPDEFKEKLKNIWEPMVDVGLVSRLILSKAYRTATEEQILLFQTRTKKLLLDTYITALLEFEDYELETSRKIKENKNKTLEVEINFFSASDSFKAKFTLYKNKQGELKIINIIIDGINLGLTFRNQFQDNLKNENYDLDKAIETWKPLYID
ncbi:MAG: ABC transporter substrate-binding protein [Pseudomonadota bacterium]|jgi:phospholipid transport system substrate-binding protein|nr:ABC transporter substrate-binding protein [Pseudomonadota bacterium]|tara:strand:- start:3481 stop:4089 length:609 start_codon:yes stop_codon:yes gene_type:complete